MPLLNARNDVNLETYLHFAHTPDTRETLCAFAKYCTRNRNCACSIKAQSETVYSPTVVGKFRKFEDLGKFETKNNIIGGRSGTQMGLFDKPI